MHQPWTFLISFSSSGLAQTRRFRPLEVFLRIQALPNSRALHFTLFDDFVEWWSPIAGFLAIKLDIAWFLSFPTARRFPNWLPGNPWAKAMMGIRILNIFIFLSANYNEKSSSSPLKYIEHPFPVKILQLIYFVKI